MPTDFSVEFHDDAVAEYDAGFDWYLERSPDAALKFDAEMDRALATNLRGSQALGVRGSSHSSVSAKTIPICSNLSRGSIQVVAVAHTSRKPGYWKQRL
jgi:plasmid stabilization system protein ParE